MVLAAGALAFAFRVAVPDRPDYIGHALAGFGGTLGLLGLALLVARRPLGMAVPALVLVAAGLGVTTEATLFHGAVWDPVDVANQNLGACLAGGCAFRRAGVWPAAVALGCSLLLVGAGFAFSF